MATNVVYHTVSPYLVVPDAPRLIAFLEKAFGARELNRHHGDGGRIMHAEVQIGDSVVMIGDKGDGVERPATIQVFVEDVDETFRRALDAGGRSESAPEDKPYGRAAAVLDHGGNQWWFSRHWS